MKKEILLETSRLLLRAWHPEDLDDLARIFSDRDVMRYFPNTLSRVQTSAFIEKMNEQIKLRSYTYFALELKAIQKLAGFTGLSYQDYKADFTPCVDIGWRLDKPYWGRGLATEAAQACLAYGFENIGLSKIVSVAPRINTASIAVMEKIGMQYKYDFDHPALDESTGLNPCVMYSIKPTV